MHFFLNVSFQGQGLDEPTVIGDIAVPTDLGNADPCTARGCKWKKAKNGIVHVPYIISNEFCESVQK